MYTQVGAIFYLEALNNYINCIYCSIVRVKQNKTKHSKKNKKIKICSPKDDAVRTCKLHNPSEFLFHKENYISFTSCDNVTSKSSS